MFLCVVNLSWANADICATTLFECILKGALWRFIQLLYEDNDFHISMSVMIFKSAFGALTIFFVKPRSFFGY